MRTNPLSVILKTNDFDEANTAAGILRRADIVFDVLHGGPDRDHQWWAVKLKSGSDKAIALLERHGIVVEGGAYHGLKSNPSELLLGTPGIGKRVSRDTINRLKRTKMPGLDIPYSRKQAIYKTFGVVV